MHYKIDCNIQKSFGLLAQNPFRMEMMKEMKRSMSHMVTENSTTKKGPPSQAEPIIGWLWKVVEIYYKYRYLLISECELPLRSLLLFLAYSQCSDSTNLFDHVPLCENSNSSPCAGWFTRNESSGVSWGLSWGFRYTYNSAEMGNSNLPR